MVVLARWCVCLSSEVREEFMSSSDSCSRETSSDEPEGGRGGRREEVEEVGQEFFSGGSGLIVHLNVS